MSGSPSQDPSSVKPGATTDNKKDDGSTKEPQKPVIALEEDDEFEDFPVDDWPQEESEMAGGNTALWEESWEDDDTTEDFSKQLKDEIKKVAENKGVTSTS